MYEKLLNDRDVPTECKIQYSKEQWYNAYELIDYYNHIWRVKENARNKVSW